MSADVIKLPYYLNYLFIKIILVVLALLISYALGDYNSQNLLANFHYPSSQISWLNAFTAWDGRFYWYLAEQGYRGEISDAFYPLYPLLIRGLSILMPTPLAGFLLSNFCLAVFIFYSVKLAEIYYSASVARLGVLLFLLFPTSFFCNLMYSESLFLMLAVLGFYLLEKHRFGPLCFVLILLVLSRPVGIFIVPALLLKFIIERKFKLSQKIILLILPTLAYLLYHFSFYADGKSLSSAFTAQSFFVAKNSLLNLLHPIVWFRQNFIELSYTWFGVTDSINDRVVFLLALPLLVLLYRKIPKELFVFTALLVLVPALSGQFMSYQRLILCAFPLIWAIADLLVSYRNSRFNTLLQLKILMILAILLQSYYLYRYANNYWVS